MFSIFRAYSIVSLALLSGCVNYQANDINPRFGIAAPDINAASGNKSIVTIPVNAPFIS